MKSPKLRRNHTDTRPRIKNWSRSLLNWLNSAANFPLMTRPGLLMRLKIVLSWQGEPQCRQRTNVVQSSDE